MIIILCMLIMIMGVVIAFVIRLTNIFSFLFFHRGFVIIVVILFIIFVVVRILDIVIRILLILRITK